MGPQPSASVMKSTRVSRLTAEPLPDMPEGALFSPSFACCSPVLSLFVCNQLIPTPPVTHPHPTDLVASLIAEPSSAHLPALYSAECGGAFFFGEGPTEEQWCLAETQTLTAFSAAALPLSGSPPATTPSYLILKQGDTVEVFPTAAEARAAVAAASSPSSSAPGATSTAAPAVRKQPQRAASKSSAQRKSKASTGRPVVVGWIELQHSRNRTFVFAYEVSAANGRSRIDNTHAIKIGMDQLDCLAPAEHRPAPDYASAILTHCAVVHYFPDLDVELTLLTTKIKSSRANAESLKMATTELSGAKAKIKRLEGAVDGLQKKVHSKVQSKTRERKTLQEDATMITNLKQQVEALTTHNAAIRKKYKKAKKQHLREVSELKSRNSKLQHKLDRANDGDKVSDCKMWAGEGRDLPGTCLFFLGCPTHQIQSPNSVQDSCGQRWPPLHGSDVSCCQQT